MIDFHVTPEWQDHALGADCWCQPTVETLLDRRIWRHRPSHDSPHRFSPETDPARLEPGRRWAVTYSAPG